MTRATMLAIRYDLEIQKDEDATHSEAFNDPIRFDLVEWSGRLKQWATTLPKL